MGTVRRRERSSSHRCAMEGQRARSAREASARRRAGPSSRCHGGEVRGRHPLRRRQQLRPGPPGKGRTARDRQQPHAACMPHGMTRYTTRCKTHCPRRCGAPPPGRQTRRKPCACAADRRGPSRLQAHTQRTAAARGGTRVSSGGASGGLARPGPASQEPRSRWPVQRPESCCMRVRGTECRIAAEQRPAATAAQARAVRRRPGGEPAAGAARRRAAVTRACAPPVRHCRRRLAVRRTRPWGAPA